MSLAQSALDINSSGAKIIEYVSFFLGNQYVGIPVLDVQEVIPPQVITSVPHSPEAVVGLLNLRGQIVTAIDLRTRLNMEKRDADADYKNVIVRSGSELFSLMVDSVGDVLSLKQKDLASAPATLSEEWSLCSEGVYPLEKKLLIALNIEKIINLNETGE